MYPLFSFCGMDATFYSPSFLFLLLSPCSRNPEAVAALVQELPFRPGFALFPSRSGLTLSPLLFCAGFPERVAGGFSRARFPSPPFSSFSCYFIFFSLLKEKRAVFALDQASSPFFIVALLDPVDGAASSPSYLVAVFRKSIPEEA